MLSGGRGVAWQQPRSVGKTGVNPAAILYIWKSKYGGMQSATLKVAGVGRGKPKLKQMYADLAPVANIKDVIEKKSFNALSMKELVESIKAEVISIVGRAK